jgi:hypothetical protein
MHAKLDIVDNGTRGRRREYKTLEATGPLLNLCLIFHMKRILIRRVVLRREIERREQ